MVGKQANCRPTPKMASKSVLVTFAGLFGVLFIDYAFLVQAVVDIVLQSFQQTVHAHHCLVGVYVCVCVCPPISALCRLVASLCGCPWLPWHVSPTPAAHKSIIISVNRLIGLPIARQLALPFLAFARIVLSRLFSASGSLVPYRLMVPKQYSLAGVLHFALPFIHSPVFCSSFEAPFYFRRYELIVK